MSTARRPATKLARALYTAHSQEMLAFFRSAHPIAKPDTIDLLQQAFTELLATLRRQPEFEIRNPRAFLFTIARRLLHRSLDRLRHPPVVDPEHLPHSSRKLKPTTSNSRPRSTLSSAFYSAPCGGSPTTVPLANP